jgi:AcrR family transcriptional regulator
MCAAPHTSSDVAGYAHGRVPRAVRERQVLDLAEELFAQRGYRGASMDELARRAGVTKPVVYAVAGSKEELYRRCVQRVADELAERVTRAARAQDDPAARLRAGGAAFFAFVAERERSWSVLFDEAEAPGHAAQLAGVRARQTRLVAGLIGEAAAELGAPPAPALLDAIAHALNGAYEWLARWWADHPDVSADTLADWVAALVMPGLEAMARDGAQPSSHSGAIGGR